MKIGGYKGIGVGSEINLRRFYEVVFDT